MPYSPQVKNQPTYLAVFKRFFSIAKDKLRAVLPTFSVRVYVDKMFAILCRPYKTRLSRCCANIDQSDVSLTT